MENIISKKNKKREREKQKILTCCEITIERNS